MKIIAITVLLVVGMVTPAFATATSETGEIQARPVVGYGKQADGTVTAILTDAAGVVQVTS